MFNRRKKSLPISMHYKRKIIHGKWIETVRWDTVNGIFTHLDALQNVSLGKVDKKILRHPNQLPRN
jgi:hypothetical protein